MQVVIFLQLQRSIKTLNVLISELLPPSAVWLQTGQSDGVRTHSAHKCTLTGGLVFSRWRFSRQSPIPSMVLRRHGPLMALWMMTPSLVPAGRSGSRWERVRGRSLSPFKVTALLRRGNKSVYECLTLNSQVSKKIRHLYIWVLSTRRFFSFRLTVTEGQRPRGCAHTANWTEIFFFLSPTKIKNSFQVLESSQTEISFTD